MIIIIFGAHMNIAFIKKMKILELIEWSYRSSQLCWLLNLAWLTNVDGLFKAHVFLVFVLRSTPNHTPLSDEEK
jgi:hypothetical protein